MYMDNNPLTYILTSAKLDATGHWWVASLANYNFALNYQSGQMNVDVDTLSHIWKGEHDQHIEADSVHALISQMTQGTTLIEAYSCNIQVPGTLDLQKHPKAMSVVDWVVAQSKDPEIGEIKCLINNKKLKGCKVYSQDPQVTKQFLRQCSCLVLHKWVLYRQMTPSKEDQNALQLVNLQSYQNEALQGCHDDTHAPGVRANVGFAMRQMYWPGMTKDAELHIEV